MSENLHVSQDLVFADGNGVTGVIGNNDNKGDQDAHEATTSMQSKPDGKTKNSSSDRSKALPRSFQVLRRDGLVDFGEATSERLAASGRDQSGLFPVLTGSSGNDLHQLRQDASGVAGILDSMREGNHKKARARAAVLLMCLDQASCD